MPPFAAAGQFRPPRKGESRNRGFLIRGGILFRSGFLLQACRSRGPPFSEPDAKKLDALPGSLTG
jgi:hypothetical protein